MKPIISVEGLGKSYTIQHEGQTHYKSLREEIFKLPQRLLRRNRQSLEVFWALKDVSFDIMPGDRVGIIGRNGAGKSTLLKLLSRITEPTTGRIALRGRVASLLEVGTGFHPELSGRENIYLNGAILGMHRYEIRRKFDEIVDFAGVEKFLDTPVKRYSSGMYVRLAFAVAAHLEPEILIVDEVLAVGDAEFQKKCLGKMEEVGRSGRTVLFVSHNMGAIRHLCTKGLYFQSGRIVSNGPTDQVLSTYANSAINESVSLVERMDRQGNGHIRFIGFCLLDSNNGSVLSSTLPGMNVVLKLSYQQLIPDPVKTFHASLAISSKVNGTDLFICSSKYTGDALHLDSGSGSIYCKIDRLPLSPGDYSIRLFAEVNGDISDWIHEAASIHVDSGPISPSPGAAIPGPDLVIINHTWKTELS